MIKKPDFTNSRLVNVPARLLSRLETNISAIKEVVKTYVDHSVPRDRIFKMIASEYESAHRLLNSFYWLLTSREYRELQHYIDVEYQEVTSYARLELQITHTETEVIGQ